MKKRFSIAMSLAVILALALTSLALAAQPARVVFTTDTPCPVNVLVVSYTDPAGIAGKTANGSTPLTLDTYPSTSVTFFYQAIVVCNGTTYNLVSTSPSGFLTSGAENSIVIAAGHYTSPIPNTDSTPPVWAVPANFSIEAIGPNGALVSYTVSVSDPDDAVSSQSCSPASGTTFALGTTTVICTATDTHGNTGIANFTVTVTDTTPPMLILPSDMTVSASNASGAVVSFSASATDLVDGSVIPICLPASGAVFPLGTTTVNCTAADSRGNTSSGSFKVNVVDNTPPALTLPANMTVTALNASGATVKFAASANDAIDGPVAVTCSPASGSLFPLGQTTVNCSTADSRGNIASGSFTVTVQYATAGNKCKGIPGHQILQPINTDGSSVFKAGSNVPARFRICGADGKPIGTAGVVTNFRLIKIISKGVTSNVDQTVLSTTSDNVFRSGFQQWIFNISTKNLSTGNTYVYLVTLNDGSTIQFQFRLK